MLHIVLQKIRNKKWLNLCLLAGITLLVAVFSCHPMFEKGADNQLLQQAMEEYAQQNGEFPAALRRKVSYETEKYGSVDAIVNQMASYETKWLEYVEVDPVASQKFLSLSEGSMDSNLGTTNRMFRVGLLMDMDSHITIVKGEDLDADTGDAFGCLVSQSVMDAYGLVVGQTMTYNHITDAAGNEAVFVITGICEMSAEDENYWYTPLDSFEKTIFVSEETFDRLLNDYGCATVATEDNLLLDYTRMNWSNAEIYADYIAQFAAADKAFLTNMTETLQGYVTQSRNVSMILYVLELPCVVLLLLFIYMVSNQIISTEEGEIAVMRSRGATRGQTVRLYLLQSAVLSLVGFFLGLLFGVLMCRLAASTDGFLVFTAKDTGLYRMNVVMLPFALAACVISVLFMSMPVWKRSKITIVEQKSRKSYRRILSFWERYFLDIVLLGISVYLLYNYDRQSEIMVQSILAEDSLDPVIFLNASLFIFACGLLFMRLSHYLVLLVNRIGAKRWNPALYASFLQITRTFRNQGFITIFLIMTIANGIFDANMARTMNGNNEERIRYNVGSDVRVQETWTRHIHFSDYNVGVYYYDEPDFGDYEQLVKDGICESVTKVLIDDGVEVYTNGTGKFIDGNTTLMSIHTKEFGETAELMDGINDTHWYNALNALAENADGAIISGNMARDLELEVGDVISYGRYGGLESSDTVTAVKDVTVCAIVDGFPGYERYRYDKSSNGNYTESECYLLVTNYADEISTFGVMPYQVWMRLSEDGSPEQVAAVLEDLGKDLTIESMEEEIESSRSSSLFQITNGLFTMSFLISTLVCCVGFLIYQIMSLKNRELLFGIYRAMGMRMGELRMMLVNEQLFGTVLAILAGGVAGALSTILFVHLIVLVYLPQKHNIAIRLIVYGTDLAKLFVVVLAIMVICFGIIRILLKNMKIAQALKLGED